jgi:hypothetical protein
MYDLIDLIDHAGQEGKYPAALARNISRSSSSTAAAEAVMRDQRESRWINGIHALLQSAKGHPMAPSSSIIATESVVSLFHPYLRHLLLRR